MKMSDKLVTHFSGLVKRYLFQKSLRNQSFEYSLGGLVILSLNE